MKLIWSKNDICVIGNGKVVIENACLFVRKVVVARAVQLAHIKALNVGTKKYPVQTKVFSASKGNLTVNEENLFLGQLLHHVVIGCLDNVAFNGKSDLNPFNFQHFDLDFMALYWDGQ